ncbi:Six-hairpin glycosidase [Lentinula aff. lateritia]|uniref:Six-hairpin glycosidase n=1 Tax=Lentinula aff. lateritia TaxID=2804960 RepID=A0ACC1TZ70_9AGAR|nr:Six-hairpin glycosidase [Lentinula aff. lateritia]
MAPVLHSIALVLSSLEALSSLHAGLDSSVIEQVRSNMIAIASQSWELGTAAEALTELVWPALSVFNASAFPPPHVLDSANNASDVLKIANDTVSAKPNDSLALVANDGAVGDPASIGVAVLLANWTDSSNTSYAIAAGEQLDYLLNVAPRTDSGAISHRSDEVQLWADFIYMAPPFIAYYGALQAGDNESYLLQTAYEQISLYRDVLRDDDGLWRHVALGNGWAAAGMLRVLETLNHSSMATDFTDQTANLTQWIQEILSSSWQYQLENGTLLNTIDDSSSFADSSGTALLASVTYRMAVYTNDTSLIPNADKAFQLVESNIDGDGWLRATVDPETFDSPSAADSASPEGQAFVLLLQAAFSDYAEAVISGQVIPSSNSSSSSGSEGSGDDDDDGSILRRCRLVSSH